MFDHAVAIGVGTIIVTFTVFTFMLGAYTYVERSAGAETVAVASTTPDISLAVETQSAAIAAAAATGSAPLFPPVKTEPVDTTGMTQYVTIVDGCGPYFGGECLNVRSGPGVEHPVVSQLRSGIVLEVAERVKTVDGYWYHVVFNEWLRYPERLAGEWYVHEDFVEPLYDIGPQRLGDVDAPTSTDKSILVDRSDQTLVAYDGEEIFLETDISTGLELTPTPRGDFTIFYKTPSRYMQGPLPYLAVSKYYDLPGVPWNLYFTEQGAVIHGAYWHESFGSQYSSGCVNVDPDLARTLYEWADVGTKVVVRD